MRRLVRRLRWSIQQSTAWWLGGTRGAPSVTAVWSWQLSGAAGPRRTARELLATQQGTIRLTWLLGPDWAASGPETGILPLWRLQARPPLCDILHAATKRAEALDLERGDG